MIPEDDEGAFEVMDRHPFLFTWGLIVIGLVIGAMILASWILREIASLFTGKDQHAR